MNTILLAIIAAAGLAQLVLGLVWSCLYQYQMRALARDLKYQHAQAKMSKQFRARQP